MNGWRDVADRVLASGNGAAAPPDSRFGLAPDLCDALAHLRRLPPPPNLHDRKAWAPIVADALRLARDGWAANALSLGWSVADLFGIGPRDDWEFAGLAVWLAGRPMLLIDADTALAGIGADRSYFVRGGTGHGIRPAVEPVLLWQFGRT